MDPELDECNSAAAQLDTALVTYAAKAESATASDTAGYALTTPAAVIKVATATDASGGILEKYISKRLKTPGAKSHPGVPVQSAAMAKVELPSLPSPCLPHRPAPSTGRCASRCAGHPQGAQRYVAV